MLKTLLIAAAALASPAAAATHQTPDARLEQALQGRVAGAPTRCISLSGSTSSEIIDGKAIIYRVGSRLYVNQPRSGAESLRDDDILVTRLFGNQLCNIDSVDLVDRFSRFPRGFVILGDFVPYTKVKTS